MGERRAGRGATASPALGWGLAATEVVLALVPIPVALALHLHEPSAVLALVIALAGAALGVWRGWVLCPRPRPGARRRPLHFAVGCVGAVLAVCAAIVVLGAAIEPLGRDASLGVTALAIAAVVVASPLLFGGPRRR